MCRARTVELVENIHYSDGLPHVPLHKWTPAYFGVIDEVERLKSYATGAARLQRLVITLFSILAQSAVYGQQFYKIFTAQPFTYAEPSFVPFTHYQ